MSVDLTTSDIAVIDLKTRLKILELLNKRRATVTEISKIFNLAKSTAHYHLNKLCDNGLARKKIDSRKWVYYEITDKGRTIVKRKRVSVILNLVSKALIFLGAVGIWRSYPEEGGIVDKVSGIPYPILFLIVFGFFMLISLITLILKIKINLYRIIKERPILANFIDQF